MIRGRVCIVLAGGLGTRLRSAVPDLPKCLAPVGDRSFLDLQIERLAAEGFDRFVLSLGYGADAVQRAVPGFAEADRIEAVVEEEPLGTGGAILHVLEQAGLEEAVVANGDTFIDAPLAAMHAPLGPGERLRIAAVPVDDRARYGGIELDGTRVTAFVEKGRGGPGLINAGLYRVQRAAFDGFAPGDAFSVETQVMPALLRDYALHAVVLDGAFIDIGVPDDYWRFCAEHRADRGAA